MERLERLRLLVAGPRGKPDNGGKRPTGGDLNGDSSSSSSDDDGDRDEGRDKRRGGGRRKGSKAPSPSLEASDPPRSSTAGAAASKRKPKEARKRPGRRQRAELKASGLDPSTGRSFKPNKRQRGSRGRSEQDAAATSAVTVKGTERAPVAAAAGSRSDASTKGPKKMVASIEAKRGKALKRSAENKPAEMPVKRSR